MKLNFNIFEKYPPKVKMLAIASIMEQPISNTLYNEAIEAHPEYFPKEIECKNRWESIPQQVKDAYWNEYWEFNNILTKDIPHEGKGIMFMIDNPKERLEWENAHNLIQPKLKVKEKELHDKYYKKYGV